ncbi:hypothetical protein QBC33DRAFT_589502 [Phialemonium atrogriseum]|uniref:Thioester reductase (TE) domain-containing protein n=1 Tax=Phialemonium atrogriseum TaxID=1093897 RepID=A0AAJ0BXY4_9PEZI|nr:uncharacterized protein QBC33DRAFT_589502 [Phialemonium atrogriseum]KAK1766321.1 hypothetical protein QBC33DRAFT_589502 [Phialemonium atrogriseum]
MDCVAMFTSGKPKRLAFVSSTSALDIDHYVQTDDLEGSREGLATGYRQSKWASEYIVREAGKRGLTGAITRPGYVTGNPESSISVTDDFLVCLWKGCLQVAAGPALANMANQVPVTRVSRIVVVSALHPPPPPAGAYAIGVAQVTSHPRLTMDQWAGALEAYGYVAPRVPYAEWSARLAAYVSNDDGGAAAGKLPPFHFVTSDLPAGTVAPELDDANTAAAPRAYCGQTDVSHDPITESAVTVETIGKHLAYLVAVGFLPPPPVKGRGSLGCLSLGLKGYRRWGSLEAGLWSRDRL